MNSLLLRSIAAALGGLALFAGNAAAKPAGLQQHAGVSGLQRALGPGPSTFTDPTGDSGTAADITTVVASSDANGQITIQVNFAGVVPTTNTTAIFFDTDQNASTGSVKAAGAEYVLAADQGTNLWNLQQWNGSAWVDASAYSTVSETLGTSQIVFSINRSDLGGTTGFNFWVDSFEGAGGPGHEDQAPDSLVWNYQVGGGTGSTVTLKLTTLLFLAPKKAKAGGTYTVGMLVQRSDTTDFLGSEGQIDCTATLAGKTLPGGVGAFVTMTYHGTKASIAVCAWHLPRSAHGKTLRGTITASYQGAHVTQTFSARTK